MASHRASESESEDVFKKDRPPPVKGKLEMNLDFMKPHTRGDSHQSFADLVVMITKETQTDWDWAEMQLKQLKEQQEMQEKMKAEEAAKQAIEMREMAKTPLGTVSELDHVRNEGIQTDQAPQVTHVSIAIQAFQEEEDIVPEPYLELKISRAETQIAETPISEKRKHGGATPLQEPWPPRSPLYGRPIMMFDDEELETIESPKKEATDITESSIESSKDGKLPRLGLPTSLQIKKDSAQSERAHTREEFQHMISEPASHPAPDDENRVPSDPSFTNLVCEFCQNQLRPFPTLEQQRTMSSSELYCCDEYRKFVEYVLATDDSFEQQMRNKIFGSTEPSPEAQPKLERQPSGQITKTKAVKQQTNNRAAKQANEDERRRRIELERHMAMLEKAKKMRETQMKEGKSVKTINFQLSKYRCYEQGMVILPADFHLSEMEQFQHRKIQAAMAEQVAVQQRRQIVDVEGLAPPVEYAAGADFASAWHQGEQDYLLEGGVPVIKKYEDKQTTFLVLLADGTSTIYYPSGNIAITVSVFNGIRTFIAFEDLPSTEAHMLAIFMSSGFGSVYTSDGTVRLSLTPAGGLEVHPHDNSKKRRWTWAEIAGGTHVHAPPFQCIFYHINSYLSVRIGDYKDWTLTFFYKQYRCRFNVMAFSTFEIVDSTAFDLADMRLIRLNKFKSQFSETHNKLKAILREINYMLGLMPANLSKSVDTSAIAAIATVAAINKSDLTPRMKKSKSRQSGKTNRQSSSSTNKYNELPPLTTQSIVEVESQ